MSSGCVKLDSKIGTIMTVSPTVDFTWFFKEPIFDLKNAIRTINPHELLIYVSTIKVDSGLNRGWDDEWSFVLSAQGELGYVPSVFLDDFID